MTVPVRGWEELAAMARRCQLLHDAALVDALGELLRVGQLEKLPWAIICVEEVGHRLRDRPRIGRIPAP